MASGCWFGWSIVMVVCLKLGAGALVATTQTCNFGIVSPPTIHSTNAHFCRTIIVLCNTIIICIMDLLEQLQLDDLPEQQTRTMHLMKTMMNGGGGMSSNRRRNAKDDDEKEQEDLPEPPSSLGFDNCATCGRDLSLLEVVVTCPNCRRIRYCSNACQYADAHVGPSLDAPSEDDDDDGALGHTAVVCSLLKLCHDDEMVETKTNAGGGRCDDDEAAAAARDRVRSEYESYPSTLANVLAEGPCYQSILRQRQRRNNGSLTIHIIGASSDAELTRGPTLDHDDDAVAAPTKPEAVLRDYADALAELVERNELHSVHLCFIGPDCPELPWENVSVPLPTDVGDRRLSATTYRGLYHDVVMAAVPPPPPDVIVLFHPGLTHPDYTSWSATLAAISPGTPFLLTSNTEMEAIADAQYLLEQDKIVSLPAGLADILQVDINHGNDDGEEQPFFAVNPFHGRRVRQNATMANDLYVKNRWMLGGIFGPARSPSRPDRGTTTMTTKRSRVDGQNNKNNNAGLI
jgi:hypothetical protein